MGYQKFPFSYFWIFCLLVCYVHVIHAHWFQSTLSIGRNECRPSAIVTGMYCVWYTGAFVTHFDPPSSLPPSLLSTLRLFIQPGGAVLVVGPVTRQHAGLYTCRAQGTASEKLELTVQLSVDTGMCCSTWCVAWRGSCMGLRENQRFLDSGLFAHIFRIQLHVV